MRFSGTNSVVSPRTACKHRYVLMKVQIILSYTRILKQKTVYICFLLLVFLTDMFGPNKKTPRKFLLSPNERGTNSFKGNPSILPVNLCLPSPGPIADSERQSYNFYFVVIFCGVLYMMVDGDCRPLIRMVLFMYRVTGRSF